MKWPKSDSFSFVYVKDCSQHQKKNVGLFGFLMGNFITSRKKSIFIHSSKYT